MNDPTASSNRFLLDEHIKPTVAEIARQYGAEVITVFDAGLAETVDSNIIDFALINGYIIVTVNRRDFQERYIEISEAHLSHPGLLIVHPDRHRNWKYIAEMIALFSEEPLTNRIEWI